MECLSIQPSDSVVCFVCITFKRKIIYVCLSEANWNVIWHFRLKFIRTCSAWRGKEVLLQKLTPLFDYQNSGSVNCM